MASAVLDPHQLKNKRYQKIQQFACKVCSKLDLSLMTTRLKNIKNVTRCRDSRSTKIMEKGRIKEFGTQLHPTYLYTAGVKCCCLVRKQS